MTAAQEELLVAVAEAICGMGGMGDAIVPVSVRSRIRKMIDAVETPVDRATRRNKR